VASATGVFEDQECPFNDRGGPESDRLETSVLEGSDNKFVSCLEDISGGISLDFSRDDKRPLPPLLDLTMGSAGELQDGKVRELELCGFSLEGRRKGKGLDVNPSVKERTDVASSDSARSEGCSSSEKTSLLLDDELYVASLSRASVDAVASSRPIPS
jgi:hypothetical protein